jgi:hypothetical protein
MNYLDACAGSVAAVKAAVWVGLGLPPMGCVTGAAEDGERGRRAKETQIQRQCLFRHTFHDLWQDCHQHARKVSLLLD